MLFPTPEFALFFFLVFLSSWGLIQYPAARKWFLVLASYFFYGFWDWRFTFLLLGVSLLAYFGARGIAAVSGKRGKKAVLGFLCFLLLGVLAFFKYYGFLFNSLNNLSLLLGLSLQLPILSVILPVGISFFTFQAVSYVADVYRGTLAARESLVDVLLYISFFPQLVAGPIVRASDFLPQLDTNPPEDQIRAGGALVRIVFGLFKKVFLANYLATLLADPVFLAPEAYGSLGALLGLYGYAFQIFCDFSAYSDIAIGTAALLGYHFPENFDQPYRSASLREFWRRWHISLSSWLRDYLYIPLGGGRKKVYRNLLVTMLLGGLWHGAAWNFVLWGLLHGLGLAAERLVKADEKKTAGAGRFFRRVGVFHFVCLCWIFFRAPNLDQAWLFIKALFTGGLFFPEILTPFTALLLVLGLGIHYLPRNLGKFLGTAGGRLPWPLQAVLLGAAFVFLRIVSPQGVAPFIYFQF